MNTTEHVTSHLAMNAEGQTALLAGPDAAHTEAVRQGLDPADIIPAQVAPEDAPHPEETHS